MSIDPLAAEYPYISAYCFAGNNPIRFIDVLGEGPGDGPFTDRAYRTDFGVRIYRITTNDRVAINLSKQLFYTIGGPVGTLASVGEDIITFIDDPMGPIGSLIYTVGTEGSQYASKKLSTDEIVGQNQGTFKTASKRISQGKKVFGAAVALYDVFIASATRSEILE